MIEIGFEASATAHSLDSLKGSAPRKEEAARRRQRHTSRREPPRRDRARSLH